MNDPFLVGLLAAPIFMGELNDCVNINTGILYSQVLLLQSIQFNYFLTILLPYSGLMSNNLCFKSSEYGQAS